VATVTRTGAIYGIGVFGQDLYGVSNVSIIPVGVEATTAIGAVTVTAGAVVLPTGVQVVTNVGNVAISNTNFPAGVEATAAVGTVTVIADALVLPVGVEATADIGTVTVEAGALVLPVGVQASTAIGSVIPIITALPAGVSITASVGTVTVFNNAVPTFIGVQAGTLIGNVSLSIVNFDYIAVREQYDRRRTIVIARKSSSQDRVIYIPEDFRDRYVNRRSTSSDRTKLVA
jgi:hypothetical protein